MVRKNDVRRVAAILFTLFTLAAALYLLWRFQFNPFGGTANALKAPEPLDATLTAQQATQDLDYIVWFVKERHPACVDGLPEAVKAAYERESAALQAGGDTTVLALWQAAARVLHPLSDAHTGVFALRCCAYHLPVSFAFEGDALVLKDGPDAGRAVEKIGGIPVSTLYERFEGMFSYELDSYARSRFAERINRSDYLRFVGVDAQASLPGANRNTVAIECADGTTVSYAFEEPTATGREAQPFASYEIGDGVAVFTLRKCDYGDDYKDMVREFFTAVRDGGVQNVILDLRDNPGGNPLVSGEFIRYLPALEYKTFAADVRYGPIVWHKGPKTAKNGEVGDLTFGGSLYVLTSAATFNSAVDFATLLSDNGLATVIGEAPGDMPTSYGDILMFQTPNAKLVFTVSYKRFVRPDAEKSDEPLTPDVAVGAGDAMDAALSLIGG
jgi:hypothetical protein